MTSTVDPVVVSIESFALAGVPHIPVVCHELLEFPISTSSPTTISTTINTEGCSMISVRAAVERGQRATLHALWQLIDGEEFLLVADSEGFPCQCGESCGTPLECASVGGNLRVRLNFNICDECGDAFGPSTVTSVRVYVFP